MDLQGNKQCLCRFRIEDLNERTLHKILDYIKLEKMKFTTERILYYKK